MHIHSFAVHPGIMHKVHALLFLLGFGIYWFHPWHLRLLHWHHGNVGIYWFHPWHLGLLHLHHGNHSFAAVSECNHEWYSYINRPNLLWTIIYLQQKFSKTCTYLMICLVIYCTCILDIQPSPFAAMYDTGYTEIFASYMILRVLWTSSVLWNDLITASHNININNPLMRIGQRWTRPVNMAYIITKYTHGFAGDSRIIKGFRNGLFDEIHSFYRYMIAI